MTKSIHYKITQVENVVVFQCLQASHTCELRFHIPNEIPWKRKPAGTVSLEIHKSDDDQLARGVELRSSDNALLLIKEIHAAIHAEFCGEWEPKQHESVRTEGGIVWEYISKDDKTGNHICIMRCESEWPDTLQCFKSVFPMVSTPIPAGPCEVAYGVEGLEEGVQVSESDLCGPCEQDLINAGRQSIIEEILDAIEGPACDELAELSEQELISIIARKFLDFGNMHIAYEKLKKERDEDMVSFGIHVSQVIEQEIKGDVKEWFADWRSDYKGGEA